jgi:hypothetical protein
MRLGVAFDNEYGAVIMITNSMLGLCVCDR